jgi:hypothetical protein
VQLGANQRPVLVREHPQAGLVCGAGVGRLTACPCYPAPGELGPGARVSADLAAGGWRLADPHALDGG